MDNILSDDFFHNQFKSAPAILVWTVIFLADAMAAFFLMTALGMEYQWQLSACLAVLGGFILWTIEAVVYNKIYSIFH